MVTTSAVNFAISQRQTMSLRKNEIRLNYRQLFYFGQMTGSLWKILEVWRWKSNPFKELKCCMIYIYIYIILYVCVERVKTIFSHFGCHVVFCSANCQAFAQLGAIQPSLPLRRKRKAHWINCKPKRCQSESCVNSTSMLRNRPNWSLP